VPKLNGCRVPNLVALGCQSSTAVGYQKLVASGFQEVTAVGYQGYTIGALLLIAPPGGDVDVEGLSQQNGCGNECINVENQYSRCGKSIQ
jgi:hypothetical protein